MAGEMCSQSPVSAVLVAAVQVTIPVPPFPMRMGCGGALPALVCREKLTCPVILSMNLVLVAAMVSVTGTVIDEITRRDTR